MPETDGSMGQSTIGVVGLGSFGGAVAARLVLICSIIASVRSSGKKCPALRRRMTASADPVGTQ